MPQIAAITGEPAFQLAVDAGPPPAATSACVARISGPDSTICFGPFCLLPAQRLLLNCNRPVHLGSRALDILITLIERRGKLVSKNELMAQVWPDTFVDQANLTVHTAALRRALGDGKAGNRYIINTPGRGYCFVAPVKFPDQTGFAALQHSTAALQYNPPTDLTGWIDPGNAINKLLEQLPMLRIVAFGEVGGPVKTVVALAMIDDLMPASEREL